MMGFEVFARHLGMFAPCPRMVETLGSLMLQLKDLSWWPSEWLDILRVHLLGRFDVIQFFHPSMLIESRAHLIYATSYLLLIISRLQGPSSLGAFGQCGVGCRVWFIGK
jgi:hypothetical protein